ncbi:hypothetical protein FZX09_02025 [Synechococcus sp. MU1643]|nr:hypothetical protein [Synechococcus sp. MU1643]
MISLPKKVNHDSVALRIENDMLNTNLESPNAAQACVTESQVNAYFECLTLCNLDDGVCYEQCILVHLKNEVDA